MWSYSALLCGHMHAQASVYKIYHIFLWKLHTSDLALFFYQWMVVIFSLCMLIDKNFIPQCINIFLHFSLFGCLEYLCGHNRYE